MDTFLHKDLLTWDTAEPLVQVLESALFKTHFVEEYQTSMWMHDCHIVNSARALTWPEFI